MVPSKAVFYKLFNLKEEKKAWKQKKTPLEDFESITGELSASVCILPCYVGHLLTTSRLGTDTYESQARISL